jgi:deoxyribonuclease-4
MYIGCHISIAGGIDKAPQRAADFGCEAMQIFTRSPQGGKAPELTPELVSAFKLEIEIYKLRTVVVHTPYYINFASVNNRIRYGSSSVVRDELERASLIGAQYVMTHLGSAGELSEKDAVEKTSEMLKKCLDGYTGSAKLLLENSAGAGNIIGDDLKELAEIIKLTGSDAIAGICLDTQHSFASGYDWRDFEKTLKRIDTEIGINKIKLLHINDSMTELGSHKDRHDHLGKGKIGVVAFEKITAFAKAHDITMIVETEHDFVKDDIALLKKLRG